MQTLAVRQAAAGHATSVVALAPGGRLQEQQLLRQGVAILHPTGQAEVQAALAAADIVHVHTWNNPDLFELLTGPLPPVRLLLWFHVSGRAIPQIFPSQLVARADVVAGACREAHRRLAALASACPLPARFVPPATEIDAFSEIVPTAHEGTRLGYVGSLDEIKLHRDVIGFCRRIASPDVSFEFVGDGGLRPALERETGDAGLADVVTFAGNVADVRPHLAGLDILFFPLSDHSAAASDLAVMEAMAAGVPPLVRSPGAYDLIDHGTDGLLTTSTEEFVGLANTLIRDPALRHRLGAAARRGAKAKFDPQNTFEAFERIYQELMTLPPRPRTPLGQSGGSRAGPLRGVEALLFALAEAWPALRCSYHQRGAEAARADAEIAAADRTWMGKDTGGLMHYLRRFPDDPWLLFWRALHLAGRGLPVRALALLAEAEKAGFPDTTRATEVRSILVALAQMHARARRPIRDHAGRAGEVTLRTAMTLSIHLVEFGCYGHRPSFLKELASAWARHSSGHTLCVTVSPRFVAAHPDVTRLLAAAQNVVLDVLTESTDAQLQQLSWPSAAPMGWILGSGPPVGTLPRAHWDIAMQRSADLGSKKVVFMELDLVLPAIAAQFSTPARIAGIWFKPGFHMEHGTGRPTYVLHEKLLLGRCLQHPNLHRILVMDPEALRRLTAGTKGDMFRPLPHIVPSHPIRKTPAEIRAELAIPAEATSLLFFGQISRRKGFLDIVAALARLEASVRARIFLIVAGKLDDIDAATFAECRRAIDELGVKSLIRDAYVSDEEMDRLFVAADVVLAPYVDHVGTSDIVVRAALHGRPVIAQRSGIVGKLVAEHRLGLTVRSGDATEIALAVHACVTGPLDARFDGAAARAFAASHADADFAQSFFRALDID